MAEATQRQLGAGKLNTDMALPADGATYDKMPSLLGALSIHQVLDPSRQVARLVITDNGLAATWAFEFRPGSRRTLARWQIEGIPPVVWHFVPPTGDRQPVLLLALYRDTHMTERKSQNRFTQFKVRREASGPFSVGRQTGSGRGIGAASGANEHPRHHRASDWHRPGFPTDLFDFDMVDLTPAVTIIRVQNPSLMPTFDQPQTVPSSIDPPHVILAGKELQTLPLGPGDLDQIGALTDQATARYGLRGARGLRSGMLVVPHPSGVVIKSLQGVFEIAITIKRPNRPGAFAYMAAPAGAANLVLVHHDDNVTVDVQMPETDKALAYEKGLFVFHREDATPYLVPTQGQRIQFTKADFKRAPNGRTALGAMQLELARLAVETLISGIPIVGDLYELGQLCFMYETGRDFWGQKVSSEELLLYGSLAAVTFAGPAAFAAGRRALRARRGGLAPLQDALEAASDPLRTAVIATGTPPRTSRVLRQVDNLPDQVRETLLAKVVSHVADADVQGAVRTISGALDEAKHAANPEQLRSLVDQDVAGLFTSSMDSFSNPTLRFEYERYLRTPRGAEVAADPATWLLSATRSPWVDAYLRQMFGDSPRAVISASLARGSVPTSRAMTQEMIHLYDTIVRRGVLPYGELEALATKLPNFRRFFELDHVVEQRFLAKYIKWTDELPAEQAFATFLVPTHAGAAAEMVRLDPASHMIKYVHQAKTSMMRQRIPHGAEHLYSVQQITDATLFTLKSLKADQTIAFERLAADFNYLALVRNEPKPRLRPPRELNEDLFTPGHGWPEARRVDGQWVRVTP